MKSFLWRPALIRSQLVLFGRLGLFPPYSSQELDGRSLHALHGRDRVDRDLLLLAAALDGQRHRGALADAAQDLEPAIAGRRGRRRSPPSRGRRAAGRGPRTARGCGPDTRGSRAATPPANTGCGRSRSPPACGFCTSSWRTLSASDGIRRHARRPGSPRAARSCAPGAAGQSRQQQRLARAAAVEDHAIRIDGKELRAARQRSAGRIDARRLPARADDGPAVFGLAAGERAGQRRGWRTSPARPTGRRNCRRHAEEVRVDDRRQVDRRRGLRDDPRPAASAIVAGEPSAAPDERGELGRDHDDQDDRGERRRGGRKPCGRRPSGRRKGATIRSTSCMRVPGPRAPVKPRHDTGCRRAATRRKGAGKRSNDGHLCDTSQTWLAIRVSPFGECRRQSLVHRPRRPL